MEAEKTALIDKKETKKSAFQALWESGFPVFRAIFKGSVNNGNNVPCSEFNSTSNDKERRVDMRLIAQGLLCSHNDKWILVPVAFCKQIDFKK